jgi:3-dehydroquinate synthetase
VGVTEAGFADEIASVLQNLNLPTKLPDYLDRQNLLDVMRVDKKKSAGQVRFALPVRIEEVRIGVSIPNIDTIFLQL